MTEEMKYWRRMLNRAIEAFAEGDANEYEKQAIQETYDEMFKRLIEKENLLTMYADEHRSLTKRNEVLSQQNERTRNFIEWVAHHSIDKRAYDKGRILLNELAEEA